MAQTVVKVGVINTYSGSEAQTGDMMDKGIKLYVKEHQKDLPPGVFDVAVTMGCGDACPMSLAKRRIDWQIPDPKLLSPDDYREVRNLIGRLVQALLQECAAVR